MAVWGFTTDENRIPGQEELEALLENTGYEKVELTGNQIRLPEDMELDLGAVGKSFGNMELHVLEAAAEE